MPIYEFKCSACDHVFERLQKLSDADPTVCPACGQEQVRRQVTAPAFRLAGSGWYETDFKKDSDKKANLASKDDGPASSSSTPAPAKSEPAAAPATAPAASSTPKAD